jgi:outer membrane protein OmpA-like peptidoglycan-associated protein
VRIHTDERAAESARAVNALAYTVGNHVAFGAGQYAPDTRTGRRLLAHELTHTMQRGRGTSALACADLTVGAADTTSEQEATRFSNRIVDGAAMDRKKPVSLSAASSEVQRLGDLRKVPTGLACPVADTSPTPPIQSHTFAQSDDVLTPSQRSDVENFVISWHAAGTNPIVRVDGYASTEGGDELNWVLSCDRAQAVAQELMNPTSGAQGIPPDFVDIFAHGETSEFSPRLEPNRRATITTTSPLPAPVCTHPGFLRIIDLQPVFLRTSIFDFAPTGVTWRVRFDQAARIWAKVGVVVNELTPVTISTSLKTAGSTDPEITSVLALRSGAGIEVFMVDNDVPGWGGAVTFDLGTADAKVLLSDRGASNTLLAHEVAHVLGLNHPGDGTASDGEANTIAQPSGSPTTPNPIRNTQTNHDRITFPAALGSTCIAPDP